MTIYDRVKRLCDERGLTISELEKQAGLGNATIAGWKRGNPRIKGLAAVAGVLGTSIDNLAGGTESIGD